MNAGIHLHYETSGAGDWPVVLIHGYSMSSVVWKKAMPLFPPAYRLYAMDMRGFGRSDKPDTGYTCAELAQDIADSMDTLHIAKAILIGHSFGSLVLQHFAANYPDRLTALILSNTLASVLPPKGITSAVEQRINGYGSVEENRKIFSAVIPRYFDALNVSPDDIAEFIDVGLQASNIALRETLKANYTTPSIPIEKLAIIQAPSLIIVSTHDPFGTFDQAVAITDALPNSQINVMGRCGHSPMWEKPEEFVEIVTDRLSRTPL